MRLRQHRPGVAASQATPVQRAAFILALIFGLVGLLGFLPGITAHLRALEIAGHHSGALLFGMFATSLLHNMVHLIFCLTGLALQFDPRAARGFLFGGAGVYVVLALYGMLVGSDSPANFIPVNQADNWLHLGLAVVMIGLGLLPGRSTEEW